MQFSIKYRTFMRDLLIRLKEKDGDYKTKCALRQFISSIYSPAEQCYLLNLWNIAKNNEHSALKKTLSFYINAIMAENPEVIGFSVFFTDQIPFSLILAKLLKKACNKKIVFGGHVIGLMTRKEKESFLKKNTCVDYLVEKEGENSLLALLNGEPLEKIPNLTYREKGIVKINFKGGVNDVSQLPPPNYTDFKIDEYVLPEPVLSLWTSRNCPWNKCIFCSACLIFNKGFRQKSVAVVMHDIKTLVSKHKVNTFFLTDPCITAAYVRRMAAKIRKAKINIHYGLMMRCETELKDSKLAAQLYKSGCRYIVLGVETLNPGVSKIINKGTDVNDVEKILLNCKKHNIYCHIAIIFGLPGQTFKDMKREEVKLRRLCDKTDFHCEINVLSVEKGTVLHKNFKKYKDSIVGKGRFASEDRKLHKFAAKVMNNLNKHRTFKLVTFDDIFLTAINSCRNS